MPAASTPIDLRIWRLLVTVAIVCALYFLREFFLPLAVASLVAFALAPVVSWLEKRVGRILAVTLALGGTFILVGIFAWISTVQIIGLARDLPSYKANLSAKLATVNNSGNTPFGRVSRMLDELQRESRDAQEQQERAVPGQSIAPARPLPVEVVEHRTQSISKLLSSAELMLAPLGYIGIVLLLAIFIVIKRDDLRDRIIGLIGRGQIYATTVAMQDAAKRVYRFLLMSLVVNVSYGIPVGIGLYLIGIPSAPLWALLAIVLRFIPYLGPLVAMAFPIVLSLAIFDGWTGPLLTIGLFVVLELISNNVIEPWLYGTSTGISSFALIVAALAWTWLWGPVGLLLSTPLTVCLLVMGKNIPQLSFLRTVLSDESALEPHEVCYHRLLAGDRTAVSRLLDVDLRLQSLEHVYATILLPALALVEDDYRRRALDHEQYLPIIEMIMEELDRLDAESIAASIDHADSAANANLPRSMEPVVMRLLCLPAQTLADEAATAMFVQVAKAHGFEAEVLSSKLSAAEIRLEVHAYRPEWVWICAVNPAGLARCRSLCTDLKQQRADRRISVGIWHHRAQLGSAVHDLASEGADSVSTHFAQSVMLLEAFRDSVEDGFVPAPMHDDEANRLAALLQLDLPENTHDELLDRTTTELTRVFDVPIALVNFVDTDTQRFASQCGLGLALAEAGKTPRNVSVCGHVVAANRAFVVEDLALDPRFAGNPLLRENRLRFYAGVPLRTSSGFPVGSLCILDHRPRTVSDREMRLMQMLAENLMRDLEARAAPAVGGDESVGGPGSSFSPVAINPT